MGTRVFGAACMALGIASLALKAQLISAWEGPGSAIFLVVSAAVQIAGGLALLFPQTVRPGAIALALVSLVVTLTGVPAVAAQPLVYASYGNLCYHAAPLAGAIGAYVLASPATPRMRSFARAAIVLFGVCCLSFAIEQVEFLERTTSLVPAWMPPSRMFWTIATTVAFAAAGLALITSFGALLAVRLVAMMLMSFGVVVWLPALAVDSHALGNWAEGLDTFAIGGAAWVLADLLARAGRRPGTLSQP